MSSVVISMSHYSSRRSTRLVWEVLNRKLVCVDTQNDQLVWSFVPRVVTIPPVLCASVLYVVRINEAWHGSHPAGRNPALTSWQIWTHLHVLSENILKLIKIHGQRFQGLHWFTSGQGFRGFPSMLLAGQTAYICFQWNLVKLRRLVCSFLSFFSLFFGKSGTKWPPLFTRLFWRVPKILALTTGTVWILPSLYCVSSANRWRRHLWANAPVSNGGAAYE